MADRLLRWFFRARFTRADMLVIVPVTAFLAAEEIGLLVALGLTLGGFFVTGFCEFLLERREPVA